MIKDAEECARQLVNGSMGSGAPILLLQSRFYGPNLLPERSIGPRNV